MPGHLAVQAGDRETAFPARQHLITYRRQNGVDQDHPGVNLVLPAADQTRAEAIDHQAQAFINLGCGDAGAAHVY